MTPYWRRPCQPRLQALPPQPEPEIELAWWLSFCDRNRPPDKKFLGACVVSGCPSMDAAVHRACLLNLDPKLPPGGEGEVLAVPAPVDYVESLIDREHWNKPLSYEQAVAYTKGGFGQLGQQSTGGLIQ